MFQGDDGSFVPPPDSAVAKLVTGIARIDPGLSLLAISSTMKKLPRKMSGI